MRKEYLVLNAMMKKTETNEYETCFRFNAHEAT